ncbi:hypothetical protein GGX14DRAFT_484461 [Mycena pura]|uniref:Fucose-specific lectin n=1 Tax=Mycena pura TaxID=153505 RepID=A0AAD6UQC9_9AGAR|nr:hypothetical protein GGX14DRAFT_484461 [Mycena pura]
MFFTTGLKALAILFCTTLKIANAATWTPLSVAGVSVPAAGTRFYMNDGKGNIQEIGNGAANSNNPPSFDTWANGPGTVNFAPFGVVNVAPASDVASVSYAFNGQPDKTRVFYQTTDGSIRVVTCCQTPEWVVDPTILAVAPLGVRISAFYASDTAGTAIVLVSWQNALGQLTERWTTNVTAAAGVWSTPVVIST